MHVLFFAAVSAAVLLFSMDVAYGHGTGIDIIKSIPIQEKEITITVEAPTYFKDSDDALIIITTTDDSTDKTVKNITYAIGLYHKNEEVFRDHFFAPDGILKINTKQADTEIQIDGNRGGPLDAWITQPTPLEMSGPVFTSGGLYTFEIEVKTIDDPDNMVSSGIHYADLTLVDTIEFLEDDLAGHPVKFRLKSYFNEVTNFEYDPVQKQVIFTAPFDWSERRMSHIPVLHKEVHFPDDFAEFLGSSYTGQVNGIDLFKASITIDDYTEEDERIVHFVLLQDHLRILKNQQKDSDQPLPDSITFTLSSSEELIFPFTAYTRSEDFRVDLSWDPAEIEPGQKINFVFTIRDGLTAEPLRNSDYTFVILQNGEEVHRVLGKAQVGGGFESYEFAEDQTGSTTIRFENIRNTGQETEFGIMVAPEFGSMMFLVLVAAMTVTVLFGTRHRLSINPA